MFTGIAALDLRSGQSAGTLRLPAEVEEVFDCEIIPGVRSPLSFDPAHDASLIPTEAPDDSFLLAAGVNLRPDCLPADRTQPAAVSISGFGRGAIVTAGRLPRGAPSRSAFVELRSAIRRIG